MTTFDDEYPTCERTYATLCVRAETLDPDHITGQLGVQPSRAGRAGDVARSGHVRKLGGWFLSSQRAVESRDVRRHILWVLDQICDKAEAIHSLHARGYELDLSCYWESAHGHGGPELPVEIMRRLVDLGLDVWFDVYFHGDPEKDTEA